MWKPNNKDGKIRVLTLIQPWAHLMVVGLKENETRGWDIPRKFKEQLPLDLLIHSSCKIPSFAKACMKEPFFRRYCNDPGVLEMGMVLGKVTLVSSMRTEELYPHQVERSRALEENPHADVREYHFGNYEPGRFAWMTEPGSFIRFERPFRATGQLGIWEMSQESFDRNYTG